MTILTKPQHHLQIKPLKNKSQQCVQIRIVKIRIHNFANLFQLVGQRASVHIQCLGRLKHIPVAGQIAFQSFYKRGIIFFIIKLQKAQLRQYIKIIRKFSSLKTSETWPKNSRSES